jgi:hypothetical protein
MSRLGQKLLSPILLVTEPRVMTAGLNVPQSVHWSGDS